jgi:TIR domain
MQIFVSWSGRPAQVLAGFLQTWLRKVIQELDPFMSTSSIAKGTRWSPEIAKRLEDTSEAIVCVTSENQDAPWLNFEAGALAKATGSRVRPLLIDLSNSDVTGPLSEFQLTSASDKEDVRLLLSSINENCDRSLPNEILDATFEREWPALEAKVTEVVALIGGPPGKTPRKREDVDLMAEILDRVRTTERMGQEQLYYSEAIYEEFRRQQPKSSPGARGSAANRRRTITLDPTSNSNAALKGMYNALRDAWGRTVSIVLKTDVKIEGKLTDIRNELPDTVLAIKPIPAPTMLSSSNCFR